jgi:hypothetical protein
MNTHPPLALGDRRRDSDGSEWTVVAIDGDQVWLRGIAGIHMTFLKNTVSRWALVPPLITEPTVLYGRTAGTGSGPYWVQDDSDAWLGARTGRRITLYPDGRWGETT